ncbi:diguanylate cyclase domain protein [Collimonas arenae]|uniref:Diguanylate cyclase domain protein n=1 Tax=Collimonas arenae TaxID=279058 RepID=A0A127PM75_9BURK|nr:diguanylate cyclase domain protein [Collimonas arenae]AMP08779.1 diguanylate cyclase domain protein [Collimonas arenae]
MKLQFKYPTARVSKILLLALGTFTVLRLIVIWSAVREHSGDMERVTIRAAQTNMDNLVRSYAANTLRMVQRFDQATKSIKFQYESNGGISDLPDFVGRSVLNNDDIPLLASIANDQGDVVASTQRGPIGVASVKDLEFFKIHVQQDSGQLYIGKPLVAPVSETESINFSRRLNRPDGSFAGIVFVSIDPAYLSNFYTSTDFGANGMVSLLGNDGVYRALRIGSTNKSGVAVDFTDTLQRFNAVHATADGALVLPAIDQVPRYAAYRQLDNYPLLASVGIARIDALHALNSDKNSYYLLAIGASLTAIGFFCFTAFLVMMLKSRESLMEYLASHDTLTGLPNRLFFQQRLQEEMGRCIQHGSALGVLFIDLNDFKAINDKYGHEAGDALLCAAAKRIQAAVRNIDIVCRLGGDEFTVVLPNLTDAEIAATVSHRIRQTIAQPFSINGVDMSIGASIGISRYPEDGGNISALLERADSAMYHAKAGG